jgi:hypothetical protein
LIAAYENIYVPDMIWFENYRRCRTARIESLPYIGRTFGRGEWIQNKPLSL